MRPALLISAAAVLLGPATAHAAYPGANGRIVYVERTYDAALDAEDSQAPGQLRAINPDGSGDALLTSGKVREAEPTFSPDGQRLAFIASAPPRDGEVRQAVWISDATGGNARLLSRASEPAAPTWSPDGKRVVFLDDVGIRSAPTDGTKGSWLVNTGSLDAFALDNQRSFVGYFAAGFIPTSEAVVVTRAKITLTRRLRLSTSFWAFDAAGDGRRLFRGSGATRVVQEFDISPDGTRIAFVASANWKVSAKALYVANLDGSGLRRVATTSTRHSTLGRPAWSPDGTRIVIAQNESDTKRGATLNLVDPVTGAKTILKRLVPGGLDTPTWQPLPRPALQ